MSSEDSLETSSFAVKFATGLASFSSLSLFPALNPGVLSI